MASKLRRAGWEGYAIEEILRAAPLRTQASYYRTQRGAELDLILERGGKRIAFKIKYSDSPTPSKGLYNAMEDLAPSHTYIVTPHAAASSWNEGLTVTNLVDVLGKLEGALTDS